METKLFNECRKRQADVLRRLEQTALATHAAVAQFYDPNLSYGYHLEMVTLWVRKYGAQVATNEKEVVVLYAAAFFHDAIEDARLTYNDVVKCLKGVGLPDDWAVDATEVVYALTNEKGRNRQERANEKYYEGIRLTPLAPFVKMCDRLANVWYATRFADCHMAEVYKQELPHFIASIGGEHLPKEMVEELKQMLTE